VRCDTDKMSARRPRVRLRLLAAASAGLSLYALWIRPRLLTWGATAQETTRAHPGDELVPEPDGAATMATTLPAPPEAVWSWLVQMGGDHGGWYSWDLLDNNGRPNTDRIVPEWQSLQVGEHLYTARDARAGSWSPSWRRSERWYCGAITPRSLTGSGASICSQSLGAEPVWSSVRGTAGARELACGCSTFCGRNLSIS
jgi:hypothetical protein